MENSYVDIDATRQQQACGYDSTDEYEQHLRGLIEENKQLCEKVEALSVVVAHWKEKHSELENAYMRQRETFGAMVTDRDSKILRLRNTLIGARTVLDRMRTSKETKFSHAMARDGAMVHIHAVVASIDSCLDG